jgi:predicted dehydrogenase
MGMKKLKLVVIGCGRRAYTYVSLISERMGDRFELVGLADPVPERMDLFSGFASNNGLRIFENADALLAEEKFADIAIIGTQDGYHVKPCVKAMQKGYDILLEKPISNRLEEVQQLAAAAAKLGRRVMVCHVMRYAPLYQKVRELLDAGAVGQIQTIHAVEGVGPWHFAHSFVRGHWAVKEKSSPIILAKSCHDMDLISWLCGERCRKVSSFGSLSFFTLENAPENAPARCTDGCPVRENCPYNALHYIDRERWWLRNVFDRELSGIKDGTGMSGEVISEWLATSPWGRCVYRCDNNVPDHQTVNLLFDRGITATFILSAFDDGRRIEIHGTEGVLVGGTSEELSRKGVAVTNHIINETQYFPYEVEAGGYAGHGGGDAGMMDRFYQEMTCDQSEMLTSVQQSAESHVIAFAAEESRLTGKTIDLEAQGDCGALSRLHVLNNKEV